MWKKALVMVIFKYNENPLFQSLVIKLAFVQQKSKLKQKLNVMS